MATTGQYNIAIGENSSHEITTGNSNTTVGYSAGSDLTTGSNNIIIGSNAQPSSETASNETVIGNSSTVSAEIKGNLKSNGQTLSIVFKSSNYTALATDEIIIGDASSGVITITLPTAIGILGRTYTVKRKNAGSNVVIVGTTSSQTIDNQNSYSIPEQGYFVKVISDGANWLIIGSK